MKIKYDDSSRVTIDLIRAAMVYQNIGYPLSVRFRFVFSRFRFGSGLYFFNYKRC